MLVQIDSDSLKLLRGAAQSVLNTSVYANRRGGGRGMEGNVEAALGLAISAADVALEGHEDDDSPEAAS